MPPKKARSSNKKKKKGNKSTAGFHCIQCARPTFKATRVDCICTRVVYCSPECRDKALASLGKHECPGPPERPRNLRQAMRHVEANPNLQSFSNDSEKALYTQEVRRTVTVPCNEYRRQLYGIRGLASSNPSAEQYAQAADQGHAPSAYMAGILYKNRFLGDFSRESNSNNETPESHISQLGVLTSDQLAFKYLLQAANAGIGVSMQSLADCYWNGQGCESSTRESSTWLWQAVLQRSANAIQMLDGRTLIEREHYAIGDGIDGMSSHILPGMTGAMGGPNLGALILLLSESVVRNNYMLPPFAGAVPTGTVNNRPSNGTTGRIPVLGVSTQKQVLDKMAFLSRQSKTVNITYCRRGAAKAATAQAQREAPTSLDSPKYIVPPAPACDDSPTDEEVHQWKSTASLPPHLPVLCTHVEAANNGRQNCDPVPTCDLCIEESLERMWVVARGSTLFSLEEAIVARGQTVIYRSKDGKMKSENFKNYSRGEAECALAVLVASRDEFSGLHCHPLFVAQDANLFWPLIYYHGSIRAALEFVAPHVDWGDKIGEVRPCPEQIPIAQDEDVALLPGDIVMRCGSPVCYSLKLGSHSFEKCSRCLRRQYCSPQCQVNDYQMHCTACKRASRGLKEEPEPQEPVQKKAARARASADYFLKEPVILHSMQANPEFNGLVGYLGGTEPSIDNRYPVQVSIRSSPIAVKTKNFYRLNVTYKDRSSGKKKIYCRPHKSMICSECSVDLTLVSTIANMVGNIDKGAIQSLVDAHFASISDGLGEEDLERNLDRNTPMECQGLTQEAKRFILNSLLKSETNDLLTSAVIAGMVCYSARNLNVAREHAVDHLETFVKVLNESS